MNRLSELDMHPCSPVPAWQNVSGFVPRPRNGLGLEADRIDRQVALLYAARGFPLWRTSQGSRMLTDLRTGAALEPGDVELLVRLCSLVRPRRIFAVGNAFGFSSLVLSYACNNAPVDVLDAEQEGGDNHRGSELTREIAAAEGRNIRVHVGFSPGDTGFVMQKGNGTYDLAFVDGRHSDRNLIMDFLGLREYLGPAPVVVFHDVGYYGLWQGVSRVLRAQPSARYRTFHGAWAWNRLGTGFAFWGQQSRDFAEFGPLFEPRRAAVSSGVNSLYG